MSRLLDAVRVLVVEDDDDYHALLGYLLPHCSITRASTAEEALPMLREGAAFDCCLVDHRLPGMLGLELVRRAITARCDVPLILLTGLDDEEVEEQALREGAADFLSKDGLDGRALARAIWHARSRTEVARAARRKDELTRAVFAASSDAMLVYREDGRYVDANPAALRLLQVTHEELVTKRVGELTSIAEGGVDDRWQRIAGGQGGEERVRLRDGSVRIIEYTTTPLATGEKLMVARDVTEQRELVARVAASDRLSALGMIAASVAHEINNPLMAIFGLIEAADAEVTRDPALGPALQEPVDLARACTERIVEIVRELKGFARDGAAADTRTNVVDAMEAVIRVARVAVGPRTNIERAYGPAPPVALASGKLQQVLLNLVVNGMQAAQSVANATISLTIDTDDAGRVVAEVSDNGPGIPEQQLRHVFEAFYTTKKDGTGLGLPISRRIIEDAGGTIEVESRVGHGTTFRVRLPRAADGPTNAERDETPLVSAAAVDSLVRTWQVARTSADAVRRPQGDGWLVAGDVVALHEEIEREVGTEGLFHLARRAATALLPPSALGAPGAPGAPRECREHRTSRGRGAAFGPAGRRARVSSSCRPARRSAPPRRARRRAARA